jgi:FSR family fosmidomycin resistance protein-like MFS transporter
LSISKYPYVLFLALMHAVNDCTGGYLIAGVNAIDHPERAGIAILLYNLFGFGLQLPLGFITDKYISPDKVLSISFLLSIAAIALHNFNPIFAIGLSGLASGCFHVAAGNIVLKESKGENSLLTGIFAAPGVVGLAIGGYFGSIEYPISGFLYSGLCLAFFFNLFFGKNIIMSSSVNETKHSMIPEKHDLIMILLVIAIAFRSATWNIFQMIYANDLHGLFCIALAAGAGKIVGGWIADKIGFRLYCMIASSFSMVFLSISERNLFFLVPGIFLLQSVTPSVMTSLYRTMPQWPGTSAGISLGLAIAIGGIVFSLTEPPFYIPFLLLGITILLYYYLPSGTALNKNKQ